MPVELTTEENWWSNGPTGPCGPDSEIFIWTGDTPPRSTPTGDERWVEVWNHVMMRYRRGDDGTLDPLPRPNVDTGLGLERLAAVLQGKKSVFETDLFEPWMRTVPRSGRWTNGRCVWSVDHLRSAHRRDRRRRPAVQHRARIRPAASGPPGAHHAVARTIPPAPLATCPRNCSSTRWTTSVWPGRPGADPGRTPRRGAALHPTPPARPPRPVPAPLLRPAHRGGLPYLHDTHGLPRDLVRGLRTARPGEQSPPAPWGAGRPAPRRHHPPPTTLAGTFAAGRAMPRTVDSADGKVLRRAPRESSAAHHQQCGRQHPFRRARRVPDGLLLRVGLPAGQPGRHQPDPVDPEPGRPPPLHPGVPELRPAGSVRADRQRRVPRDQGGDARPVTRSSCPRRRRSRASCCTRRRRRSACGSPTTPWLRPCSPSSANRCSPAPCCCPTRTSR